MKKNVLLFLLAVVLLNGFFWCIYIPHTICRLACFAFSGLLFLIALYHIFTENTKIFTPVIGILLMLFISLITANLFHDQPLILTVRVVLPWFGICFCFFLYFLKANERTIYNSVFSFIILYIILYLLALSVAPRLLFDKSGFDNNLLDLSRGWYRIKIAEGGLLYFMLFWQINKFLLSNAKKYLFFFIVCMTFVMLTLSRQHMLITIIMTGLFFMNKSKWYYKVFFVIIIAILFVYVIPEFDIYKSLMNLTRRQMEENSGGRDDVRLLAYKYYFNYNSSIWQDIFGNGLFHSESKWGRSIAYIMQTRKVILADVGLAGFYFYFGILGCATIGWYIFKIISFKFDKEFAFIKYFTVAILFGTIFSHQFDTSLIGLSVSYYLMYLQDKNHKVKRLYTKLNNSSSYNLKI